MLAMVGCAAVERDVVAVWAYVTRCWCRFTFWNAFFSSFFISLFLRFSAENAFFVVGLVFQDVVTGVSTISNEILEKLIPRIRSLRGHLCWGSRGGRAREFADADGKWVFPSAGLR